MDFLLEKLRRNMEELSVQGDDFTRRICHLYITFEEFLEQQKLAGRPDIHYDGSNHYNVQVTKRVEDSSGIVGKITRRCPRRVLGYSDSEDASNNLIPPANTLGETRMKETLNDKIQISSTVLECSGTCHHKCRYKRGHRKAYNSSRSLRTVKCVSDFNETGDTGYTEVMKELSTSDLNEMLPSRVNSDGEKDSTVCYAGTNSVDSGYKSSCPTPDLSEIIGHENKQTLVDRQAYARSRILMGTKVINRPSQYADRNLEQLLYLRQSILIAMQRYEQQKSKSCPSPSFRPRSLSASTSGYQYGKQRLKHQARPLISSYPSSRTQSPSYNPRILPTENTLDLINYDNFALPDSYTSTSDDRYWYSSSANLRMQQERNSWRSSTRKDQPSSSEYHTSPISSQSGGASEVAKCMLEIVEDLRKQYYIHGDNEDVNSSSALVLKPLNTARKVQQSVSSITPSASSRLGDKFSIVNKSPQQDRQSASLADYHVYEEIMYDLATKRQDIHKAPPLPKRPDSILFNSDTCSKKF